jgi:uncharacterized protein YecE (DUF72 family)
MGSEGKIKTGCGGFAVSQRKYFQIFPLVEIQQTFYQLPRIETALKWREAAPTGFEFTMKAWQLITHEPTSPTYRRLRRKPETNDYIHYGKFQDTEEVKEASETTLHFAKMLGAVVIVFQCPASFLSHRENIGNLQKFFNRVRRDGIEFAWEPRGDWPEDIIVNLCKELQLIHCLDPFKGKPRHGKIQYFRLHGIRGYGDRYTDEELQTLRRWIGEKPT